MGKELTCIVTLALALGCKSEAEKTSATEKTEATAAVSTAPVLDNKIASAVANAAKSQPESAKAATDGPPEDGILGAARADAEVPKGSAPTIKLGSAGSEPRVVLGNTEWGDKRPAQLELSVRTGAGIIPTTTFKLELTKAGAAGAGAPSHTLPVVSSELAATQPAEIPPSLGAEIRKLKGGQFALQSSGTTLVGTPAYKLGAGANPQLESLMQAGAAALNDAMLAFPKEPVGVGAVWIAKSRETLFGADVVAYRMAKLTELNGTQVVLDVNTKRYLADSAIGLPGLEQSKVHQFQAESSTQMTLAVGSALPLDGRSQTSLRAFVEIDGQPRPVQLETRSLFTFAPVGPNR